MTAVAVLVVDKVGRRPLLLGGVSGIVSLHPLSRASAFCFNTEILRLKNIEIVRPSLKLILDLFFLLKLVITQRIRDLSSKYMNQRTSTVSKHCIFYLFDR